MGDSAEKFIGVAFFLQRIRIGVCRANQLERGGAKLPALPLARRFD